jgi:hypothetical protein
MMKSTVVAIFDNIAVAQQVVEDLLNAEFATHSISLIARDSHSRYSHSLDQDHALDTDTTTNDTDSGFVTTVDALAHLLGGLNTLMIPGIGMTIVTGPISLELSEIIAINGTNHIVDVLIKSGIAEGEAPYYDEGIRHGGTLVSVHTDDIQRAEDIMNRYGSINIHERINLWRQTGWKDFDPQSTKNDDTEPALPAIEKPPEGGKRKAKSRIGI